MEHVQETTMQHRIGSNCGKCPNVNSIPSRYHRKYYPHHGRNSDSAPVTPDPIIPTPMNPVPTTTSETFYYFLVLY